MAVLTQLSYHVNVSEVLDQVKRAYDLIMSENTPSPDNSSASHEMCGTPELVYTSMKGRPYFNIPEETLLYFMENGFSIKNMAAMLSVSERTIKNRMSDYGMSIKETYCSLSDEELEPIISAKIAEFPTIGYKTMMGHLRSDGIKIPHSRLRKLM